MAKRLRDHSARVQLRQPLAEHPFGTIKRAFGFGYCLLRGLVKVAAEVSLAVFADNLRRAINILGVPRLRAVLRERIAALSFDPVRRWLRALLWFAQRLLTDFSHRLTTG